MRNKLLGKGVWDNSSYVALASDNRKKQKESNILIPLTCAIFQKFYSIKGKSSLHNNVLRANAE